MSLMSIANAPYARVSVAVNFGGVTPRVLNSVLRAFEKGYIASRAGEARGLYEALAEGFGLPAVGTSLRGYSSHAYRVAKHIDFSDEYKAARQVFREVLVAEQVARRLEGEEKANARDYWYEDTEVKFGARFWASKILPDAIVKPFVQSPLYQERLTKLKQCIAQGAATLQ